MPVLRAQLDTSTMEHYHPWKIVNLNPASYVGFHRDLQLIQRELVETRDSYVLLKVDIAIADMFYKV